MRRIVYESFLKISFYIIPPAIRTWVRSRRRSPSAEIVLRKALPRRQQFHLVVQLPFALQQLATECLGSPVRRLLKAIRLLGGK